MKKFHFLHQSDPGVILLENFVNITKNTLCDWLLTCQSANEKSCFHFTHFVIGCILANQPMRKVVFTSWTETLVKQKVSVCRAHNSKRNGWNQQVFTKWFIPLPSDWPPHYHKEKKRWRSWPPSFLLPIWPTPSHKMFLIIQQWSRLPPGSQIINCNYNFCNIYSCSCFLHWCGFSLELPRNSLGTSHT